MNSPETNSPEESVARDACRRALPRWAQLTILLVVFASGVVVGAMTTSKIIHARLDGYRQRAAVFPRDIVPRLQMQMQLSDSQTKQIYEILERRHPRMVASRRSGAQAMLNEFDAMEQEIAGVLDDRQKDRWRTIADFVRRNFLPPAPGESQER